VTLEAEVVIAGAGPTGLALAAELALRGIVPVVLERHRERPGFVRAFNLNARSLEYLDRRGVADRFIGNGWRVPVAGFAGLDAPLDFAGQETDYPYTLGIPQTRTEELLEEWAAELGVRVRRGHEVTGLWQDAEGVTVEVRDGDGGGHTLRARWLVGCDGGRSTVRKRAGIAFPGTSATLWALLGDVEVEDPDALPPGDHRTPRGSVFVVPRPGYVRICTRERETPTDRDAPVTLEALSDAVRFVLGREVTLKAPRWLTRFGDAARLAEHYRLGRVLLAGDAAHIHPPAGAQGLNVGLHDAFNLGWKLAAEVVGHAPPGLLDGYHDERHAVGERLLLQTRAQTMLGDPTRSFDPLRDLVRQLGSLPEVRRFLTAMVTGLDTRYLPPGASAADAHPLLGRLAPNEWMRIEGGSTSVAEVLSPGDTVLLVGKRTPELLQESEPWAGRLRVVCPEEGGGWLREVDAALLRPDGHVAWMESGERAEPEPLAPALRRWLGEPLAPRNPGARSPM
jgi:2-polyprenyl-6-methoxyphenol hydroxylase-like FAD-dependent oxidoreductase